MGTFHGIGHSGAGKKELADKLKDAAHTSKALPKGLYGLTSSSFGQTHAQSARIFLEAGAKIIQYREEHKEKPAAEMLKNAEEIKAACEEHGALFIVNDRVDIAVAVGADGVHLGTDDMPIDLAKKQFKGIIGASASSLQEALSAQAAGADYLGIGSVFPTGTKVDSEIIGLEEFRKIRDRISLPIYAIGGINYGNMLRLKSLNIDGIAVISAVLDAEDPVSLAKGIIKRWG
ncbi:MAG: thiamine phosphate synthase [Candidatus Micrarchaeaceae archaeon]